MSRYGNEPRDELGPNLFFYGSLWIEAQLSLTYPSSSSMRRKMHIVGQNTVHGSFFYLRTENIFRMV